ncbi:MAG: hypothetical protein NTZ40_01115 [Cyanobacteria bacterium]|nr:hypothetical protein [Cyanobacteriota bacterium]
MASRHSRPLALLGLIVVFWPSIAANAAIVLTVKQDGSDVVISGSGSANTTDLYNPPTNPTPRYDYTNVLTYNQIYAGPAAFPNYPNTPDVDVNQWSGLTGPSSFGNDPNFTANPKTGSGDLFGLVSQNGTGKSILVLPLNYVSGAILDGTSRFNDSTLAGLGLSPGVFSWSWGSHPNADSFQIKVEPVPVPAPLPLAGIAVAWRLAKRMRSASRDQRRQDRFKIPQSIQ